MWCRMLHAIHNRGAAAVGGDQTVYLVGNTIQLMTVRARHWVLPWPARTTCVRGSIGVWSLCDTASTLATTTAARRLAGLLSPCGCLEVVRGYAHASPAGHRPEGVEAVATPTPVHTQARQ